MDSNDFSVTYVQQSYFQTILSITHLHLFISMLKYD